MSLKEYLAKSDEQRLEEFMSTLSITNRTPEYYVNWNKVKFNTKKYELELNTLNYLLGKSDIKEKAYELFQSQPNLLKAVPSLIASRDKELNVLFIDKLDINITNLDFNNPDLNRINEYIDFMDESGLLNFMKNNLTNNLVDYVYGVETGLDSNGRKNRSGSIMEHIVEEFISNIIKGNDNFAAMSQASKSTIYEEWGFKIPIDKSSRRYDNAIFNRNDNKLYLIETNYYGGGGSKLKAVAGEFSDLNLLFNDKEDITFIWITDGQGWHTASIPLLEAFSKIDYIFNLNMLQKSYLKDLIFNNY